MAALQFAAFPRPQGILLNRSPIASPYAHGSSLPGTPRLISSVSSLSSSGSSNSPHTSDADNYFLTYASAKDTLSVPRGTGSSQPKVSSVAKQSSKKHRPGSAPQTRRIRFAPLPEPHRDDDVLPEVFINDSEDDLAASTSSHDAVDHTRLSSIPSSRASSRPSSLLLSGVTSLDGSPSDNTPTLSTTTLNTASTAMPSLAIPSTSGSGIDRGDYEWDACMPISPATTTSSLDHYPESPASRRVDLPPREKPSWSAKLLRTFRPRSGTGSSAASESTFLGSRESMSGDGISSGSSTPARVRSRSQSRERFGEGEFGAPLARTQSGPEKRKTSFFSVLGGGSSSCNGSTEGGIWRTQSATDDTKRVRSREGEDLRRVRSGGSSNPAQRKPLLMLNGRVYGGKRRRNTTNLFANARDEPEFVEWGYGGMGSVKTAASVGADNRWSRVAGQSAFGSSAGQTGWGKEQSRGRVGPRDDDDDGSGLAWVKRRREQREREKREKEATETTKAAKTKQQDRPHQDVEKVASAASAVSPTIDEKHDEKEPSAQLPDPDPPGETAQPKSEGQEEQFPGQVAEDKHEARQEQDAPVIVAEPEHVTTAVTIPAVRTPTGHHRAVAVERVPSASHVHTYVHRASAPERQGSTDTARAPSPDVRASSESAVGELDEDELDVRQREGPRERRESESSFSASASTETEDDSDAEAEDSPKEGEDDDDEDEDEGARLTARGAGVEKISRHKEKTQAGAHAQEGAMVSV